MADSTVAALSAGATLTGAELLYAVQDGGDVKITVDQIKDYILGSPIELDALTDTYDDAGTDFVSIGLSVSSSGFAAGSRLLTLIVNSNEQFGVDPNGGINATNNNNQYQFNLSGSRVLNFNSTALDIPNNSQILRFGSSNDLILGRAAAASLRLGAVDAASPVAQKIGVQSVVAGTTNTAGTDLTITGSQGTGTGAGGNIVFQTAVAGSSGSSQNALSDAFAITTKGVQARSNNASSNPTYGVLTNANYGMNINLGVGQIEFTLNTAGGGAITGNGIFTRSGGSFAWSSTDTTINTNTRDTFLTRPAAANIQLGNADAASPVAQTLSVQSAAAGNSNVAGVDFTVNGSRGTGSGAGGAIIFKTAAASGSGSTQNSLAEVMRLLADGNIKFTNAANFTANSTTATVLGSVGPAGAQTTVQEWLTFQNASGTTRYVPCF